MINDRLIVYFIITNKVSCVSSYDASRPLLWVVLTGGVNSVGSLKSCLFGNIFFSCFFSSLLNLEVGEFSPAPNRLTDLILILVVIPFSTVPGCLAGLNQTPSVSSGSASASVTIFPVLTSHNMEIYSSESSPLATHSPACTE